MQAIKTVPITQLTSYKPEKYERNFEGIISINMTNEVLGRPYDTYNKIVNFNFFDLWNMC